jgi:uncharacterized OsmC-like protein
MDYRDEGRDAPGILPRAVREYRARVVSGAAPRESVAVTLTRRRGFVHAGQSAVGHVVAVDEPVDFGGEGSGADPAELMLIALGASLSVTMTAQAVLREVVIETLEMQMSAWMDPLPFFELADAAEGGLRDVRIVLRLKSDAPEDAIQGLVDLALRASPVAASLKRAPSVELVLQGRG